MTTVDFVKGNSVKGEVAQQLQAQGRLDPGGMRPFVDESDGRSYVSVYTSGDPQKPENYKTSLINTNATLRKDEWKRMDDAVIGVARERLNGIQDLIDKGLTFNLQNPMGTTVLEYQTISDAMEAGISMDAVTRTEGDRPTYGLNYMPLPIIHSDYDINARVLAASRNSGNALDNSMAELASRRVSEKLENMLFTDESYTYGGGTIHSYLNVPDRNQVALSEAWDASGKTAEEIVNDVIEGLKQTAIDAKHFGPYALYIPTAYEAVLDKDYSSNGKVTIRERIKAVEGVDTIKVIDTLPANNILFVEMKSDVIRLVRGMALKNIEWSEEGKMVTHYKVITIQVPQIRVAEGIVHMS